MLFLANVVVFKLTSLQQGLFWWRNVMIVSWDRIMGIVVIMKHLAL
jgi:hypothetical protein